LDLGVQGLNLCSNDKEIFLLPLFDYLQQIVLQLLAYQHSPFDIVLVDEVLLTKESFILCFDVLMQQINFGQMVGCKHSVAGWTFP